MLIVFVCDEMVLVGISEEDRADVAEVKRLDFADNEEVLD